MNKPKLIILEGVDKVGKTSVYQTLRRMTNYGPLVIDRFLGSNYAYDLFWGREHYIKNYDRLEKSLMKSFDVYLIYLICSGPEHKRRLKKEDTNFETIKRITVVDRLFYLYYNLSPIKNKTIIDTAKKTSKEVASLILEFMDKIETEPPLEWSREINKIKYNKTIQFIAKWRG